MIEEGTVLQQRYRIEKHIGQGGMGTVCLATDERFGSRVAIKETLCADDHFQKAFEREARLLNSLKHSALPKVSDHFRENDSQYIVMEYIGGEDLAEQMEKTGEAYDIETVRNWTEQLLKALEYLHGQENPVIHRDIKPQNLKLTTEGQVVLLDFGLAKGNPTDANHQTAANSIFGYSRNYASLEQIQGTGTDPRSDLYSLAATIYHLATGKPPADALTRVMMVLNEEKDPLIPPSDIHGQVPPEFSDAIVRAMSLNANQRPQSASEMRDMISGAETTGALKERETLPENPLETNFFAKNTKVMPPEETSASVPKTERKTEVLPSMDSEARSVATRVKKPRTSVDVAKTSTKNAMNAGVITRSYGNRSNMVTAAVAGVLLLVGSVAAGVYWFNQDLFGSAPGIEQSGTGNPTENTSDVEAANPTEELDITDADEADDPDSENDSDLAEEDSTTEDPVTVAKQPSRDVATSTVPPSTEKAPVKKTDKAPDVQKAEKVETDDVKITDKEIRAGDVSIKDGKVEIKKTDAGRPPPVRVEKRKLPNRPIRRPPITRAEYEKLSPAQKAKVRKALEQWRIRENKRRKRLGLPPIPRSRLPKN